MMVKFSLEVSLTSTNFEEDRDILYRVVRDKVLELRATMQLVKSQTTDHVLPMPEIVLIKEEFGCDLETYELDDLQAEVDREEA